MAFAVTFDGGLSFYVQPTATLPLDPGSGTLGLKATAPTNITDASVNSDEAEGLHAKAPLSALTTSIETAQPDTSSENLAYTVRVQSHATENEQLKVRLALPAGAIPMGSVVEVSDAQGTHSLNAELLPTTEGGTALVFSDWLAAGGERAYTMRLHFKSLPTPERAIVTIIEGAQTGYRNQAHSYFRPQENGLDEMVTSQMIVRRAPKP